MDKYVVVSFSGGKDSTAMLLRMIELREKIDEIIFCDTTVEFPELYAHVNKIEEYINRPITKLKQEHSFEYLLLNHVKRNGTKGYSFPDMHNRWCTTYFKVNAVKKHLAEKAKEFRIVECVGIASDEKKRAKDKRYPLIEWGWTEKQCLEYCYSKGFDWGGLYKKMNRLSCWCCPLQKINDFKVLRKIRPDMWQKILGWEAQTWRTLKPGKSAKELERRFKNDDLQMQFDFYTEE